ncbi:MAG: hypothetical protein A2289_10075 [Deltaproteobacteria bacterium RIFOXYA12_FULL_58_15]|nr:MAG: hypothetical protein A2289_10075 [Deltaproteobacteria bacterium RIFOXYA12_FULL_58_15]OGR08173.1 MAG: hypothetical protein A2341_20120 [Deltaproteobacteria bacterium RIFOXYB12_FULL_58_9]
MPNNPRYWTQEFIDKYVKALGSNPGFQKAAKSFKNRIVLVCYDTPDGVDARAEYNINRGKVEVELRTEKAPSSSIRNEEFNKNSYLARTSAPYGIWVKLDRGEMNVVQAIFSPAYKLDGSKLKIMANMPLFNAMNAVAAAVPKTY